MASAERVEIVQPKPPATIVLTLSETEAETLLIVCRNIGGSPATTRRGDMSAIQAALNDAGVKHSWREFDEIDRANYPRASIHFLDRGSVDPNGDNSDR